MTAEGTRRGRKAAPLAPPRPAGGEGSVSERSEGIRVRGRSRESELVDKPPHPICFASPGLRSQIDLSPHAGRGWSKRTARCHLQAARHRREPCRTRGEVAEAARLEPQQKKHHPFVAPAVRPAM